MKERVLTGIAAIPLFLVLCVPSEWVFLAFVTLLTGAGLIEWNRVYGGSVRRSAAGASPLESSSGTQTKGSALPNLEEKNGAAEAASLSDPRRPMFSLPIFAGCLFPLLASGLAHKKPEWVPLFNGAQIAVVLMLVSFTATASKTGVALGKLRKWSGAAAGVGAVYLGLLLSALVLLRSLPKFGTWALLSAVFCVWASDTGAYFAGRAWGKRSLAPSLSPKKTVEGALGGLAGSVLVGIAIAVGLHLSPIFGGVLGVVAGIAGPLGDLWESALKREAGIKDFGTLLPGHGGVLDRFDSLLFVAPFAYLLWTTHF